MFFDQFDEIYCINLAERTDRWKAVQAEFEKVKIHNRIKRFEALSGKTGFGFRKSEDGCRTSHVAVVKLAKEAGLKNVLVFEDDVTFVTDVPDLLVPQDYALFYLGFYFKRGSFEKVNDDFLKLTSGCYCLHSYSVNYQCYDLFIRGEHSVLPIDIYCILEFQSKLNCYSFNPPVAFQNGSKSNLRQLTANWLKLMVSNYNSYALRIGTKFIPPCS